MEGIPGGPQLLEALNAGTIDFGTAGEAPPIFAQAAGSPLVYVGVRAVRATRRSHPGATGRRSAVADLRGKRIALNKGSNVHYLLVEALAKAGLTPPISAGVSGAGGCACALSSAAASMPG